MLQIEITCVRFIYFLFGIMFSAGIAYAQPCQISIELDSSHMRQLGIDSVVQGNRDTTFAQWKELRTAYSKAGLQGEIRRGNSLSDLYRSLPQVAELLKWLPCCELRPYFAFLAEISSGSTSTGIVQILPWYYSVHGVPKWSGCRIATIDTALTAGPITILATLFIAPNDLGSSYEKLPDLRKGMHVVLTLRRVDYLPEDSTSWRVDLLVTDDVHPEYYGIQYWYIEYEDDVYVNDFEGTGSRVYDHLPSAHEVAVQLLTTLYGLRKSFALDRFLQHSTSTLEIWDAGLQKIILGE